MKILFTKPLFHWLHEGHIVSSSAYPVALKAPTIGDVMSNEILFWDSPFYIHEKKEKRNYPFILDLSKERTYGGLPVILKNVVFPNWPCFVLSRTSFMITSIFYPLWTSSLELFNMRTIETYILHRTLYLRNICEFTRYRWH